RTHFTPSATRNALPGSARVSPKGYSSRCSLGFIQVSVVGGANLPGRILMASYDVNVNWKYINGPGKNRTWRAGGTRCKTRQSRPANLDYFRACARIRHHATNHPLL